MDNESGFNSQIHNGQIMPLNSTRGLTKGMVIYIHTMFPPWKSERKMRKSRVAGKLPFITFSLLLLCIQKMDVFKCQIYVRHCSRLLGHIKGQKKQKSLPSGSWPHVPLFSKGLQFYRSLNMARICCCL